MALPQVITELFTVTAEPLDMKKRGSGSGGTGSALPPVVGGTGSDLPGGTKERTPRTMQDVV